MKSMDESTVTPSEVLKEVRESYDSEVISKQKETLSKLKVSKEKEILGEDLDKKIEEAFQSPATFSSESVKRRAKKLNGKTEPTTDDIQDVREIDGYLVRKKSLSLFLKMTEVFEKDFVPTDTHKKLRLINLYKYKHQVITDTRTGLSAEVMDTNPNIEAYLHTDSNRSSFFAVGENIVVVGNSDQNYAEIPFKMVHEMGHSHASEYYEQQGIDIEKNRYKRLQTPSDLSDEEVAKFVVEERNASAFSLAVARRYSKLGVGLTDIVRPTAPEKNLQRYDKIVDKKEFRFSKRN